MSEATTVILQGPQNWDLWLRILKQEAINADVWLYMDPNTNLEPPPRPVPPVNPAAAVQEDDAAAAGSSTATQPGGPTVAPTPEQITAYAIQTGFHYKELKEYRRTREKIGHIQRHINSTIVEHLLEEIKFDESIREQLKRLTKRCSQSKTDREYQLRNLTRRCSQSETDRKYQAQLAYNTAKVFHPRRENFEDWASSFQTAYDRAKQLNLPEVAECSSHRDLLNAISQIDSSFTAEFNRRICAAEESSVPSDSEQELRNMLAEYLRYYRTNHKIRTTSYGVPAAATLNKGPSPSNKRKKTQYNAPSKPCLCGDMHYWGQCPYVDETLRQKGFLLDPEKVKKITEFEAKDPKGILNKIREKNKRYKRSRTQPPDSDS